MGTLHLFEIQPGADVSLKAGNEIILRPGFHAAGGDFEAKIEPCNSNPVVMSLIPQEEEEEKEENKTGTKEIIIDPVRFSIFPNPAKSEFSVSYTLDKNDFVKMELYTINGSKLKTLLNVNNQAAGNYYFNFSVSELSAGIYVLVFTSSSKKYTYKLIEMKAIIKLKVIFIICTILLLIPKKGFGQEEKIMHHAVGLNLLQLPATTIDITYAFSNNLHYDFLVNTGFTFNYSQSIDYIGWLLTPHYKCGNDGFTMIQQTGAFLKGGMKYNFRKSFDKKHYFFFSGYVCSSWIYEEADILLVFPEYKTERLKHHRFIYGFTGAVGYHIHIYKKLSTNISVNISYTPDKTVNDLYGYQNYIPGMGFMETCGNTHIFPIVVWSIKYQIQ